MRKKLLFTAFALSCMLLIPSVSVSAQTLKLDTAGPDFSGNYLLTYNTRIKIDRIGYISASNPDQSLDDSWENTGVPGAAGTDGQVSKLNGSTGDSRDNGRILDVPGQILPSDLLSATAGILQGTPKTVYKVGDTHSFTTTLYYNTTGNKATTFTAKCIAVTDSCTLWYNTADGLSASLSEADAAALADRLQASAETMKSTFGDSSAFDMDEDGKTAFVFYPMNDRHIGGFFSMGDLFATNKMDMLNINSHSPNNDGTPLSTDAMMGILVHEWQHLINCCQTSGDIQILSDEKNIASNQYKTRSYSWLNEAFSQSSTRINGYGDIVNDQVSGTNKFMASYKNSLTIPFVFQGIYVPQNSPLSIGSYVNWYLFGGYLSGQTAKLSGGGDAIYKTIFQTVQDNLTYNGMPLGTFGKCDNATMVKALNKIGYKTDLDSLLRNFILATYFRQSDGLYSLGNVGSFKLSALTVANADTAAETPKKLPGGYSACLTKITDGSITVNTSSSGKDIRHAGVTVVYDGVKATKTSNGNGTTSYALSTTDTDTKIYYTTDGSTPTAENGKLYDGTAVTVSDDAVLKAIDTDAWGSSRVYTFRAQSALTVRLSGSNRYNTMALIAKSAFMDGCETVILASGANWPDALAASALAGTCRCPVLLTEKSRLSWQTAVAISQLNATKAIIIGSTDSVSQSVQDSLYAFGMEEADVTRIAGSSRTQTADRIAAKVMEGSTSDTCFIVSGKNFPDALSVSAYAYANKTPVLLTGKDGMLTNDTLALAKNFKKIYIIGGENSVSSKTDQELSALSPVRIAGSNRYETSEKIIRTLYGGRFETLAAATGASFPDAVAGAALAGADSGPILLVNGSAESLSESQKEILEEADSVWILGSESSVSAGLQTAIEDDLK